MHPNSQSTLLAFQAACDHMKSWFGCTPADDWVSMGVFSDGSYGTPEGVMFSFPVTTKEGRWSIVQVSLFTVLFVITYSFN
jgi:malate/lactate dehydrogenase